MNTQIKYWTSISSYLWKNTWNRWVEAPASPLSKILLPSLLCLLSISVILFFISLSQALKDQLSNKDLLTLYSTELIRKTDHSFRASSGIEIAYLNQHPKVSEFLPFKQLLRSGIDQRNKAVPIFIDESESALNKLPIYYTNSPVIYHDLTEIDINGLKFSAEFRPSPKWLESTLKMKHAIFIPSYLLTAFTTENYVQHQIIRSNTLEDLSAIHLQLEAFHSADQRSVNLSHSLHILKEFHRLQNAQIWMRLVTLLLSSSVLSLCLGCISWLEYRDQRYLIALLRSFGIPPLFLAAHQFISDLLLVLLSMTAVIFLWPSLSSFLMKNSEFAFTNTYLPPFEVLAIYLSGILGVSLANIPVWRALKKPIGEVLQ